MQLNSNKAMPDSDSKWKLLSPSAKTALGILPCLSIT
jgi:hypothetical protein